MNEGTTVLHIAVSKWFWRMATEAIRIRSNETYRSEIFDDVVAEIALATPEPKCATDLLRRHLEIIPSSGPIELTLHISEKAADNLAAVSHQIAHQLASTATVTDAISLLLYDFIATHHADKILGAVDDALGKPN